MAKNMEEHSFYCIKCGKKGIPILRNKGFQHSKHHRKKLYCPYCKIEINHIECKNFEDVQEFLNNFKDGKYLEEVEQSISYLKLERRNI